MKKLERMVGFGNVEGKTPVEKRVRSLKATNLYDDPRSKSDGNCLLGQESGDIGRHCGERKINNSEGHVGALKRLWVCMKRVRPLAR